MIWKLLNLSDLGPLLQLYLLSALKEDGWFKSFRTKMAVDKKGNPIPWYTYSFIKFLEFRLQADFLVFEYGCGNSTRWFSNQVKSIISVEDDPEWVKKISAKSGKNVRIILGKPEEGSYVTACHHKDDKFDLVIVDGKERNECLRECVKALSERGVVILDNSNRSEYQPGIDFLLNQGFRKIDFWGMAPVDSTNYCTTVFYRKNNCLGI